MMADLALQGVGAGFFQVAYMEIVMGTLPLQHRGVAGSLSMLTRTIGTVTGATLLTLAFYTIEGSAKVAAQGAGQQDAAAFLAAYALTFRLAGVAAGIIGVLIALTRRTRR
jgi:MFS family permease